MPHVPVPGTSFRFAERGHGGTPSRRKMERDSQPRAIKGTSSPKRGWNMTISHGESGTSGTKQARGRKHTSVRLRRSRSRAARSPRHRLPGAPDAEPANGEPRCPARSAAPQEAPEAARRRTPPHRFDVVPPEWVAGRRRLCGHCGRALVSSCGASCALRHAGAWVVAAGKN